MTYKELYDNAQWKFDHNDITVGEYVEMIKPLNREIDVLDNLRAEIENIAYDWQEIDGEHESRMVVDLNDALEIIDKYKAESEDKG